MDMDFFLHGYNNIFPFPCKYMLTNPSSIDPPNNPSGTGPPTYKKKFLFPTVELFQLARSTDITK